MNTKVENKVELPKHRQELVDMVIENLSKGHIPWHRGWSNEDYPQKCEPGHRVIKRNSDIAEFEFCYTINICLSFS